MRKTWWISLTILESALAFGFGLAGPSKAQEGHDHAAATREVLGQPTLSL